MSLLGWLLTDDANSFSLGHSGRKALCNALRILTACVLTSSALAQTPAVPLTLNREVSQVDPANTNPINFTAVFTEPMDPASFTPNDINLGGTSTDAVIATPITLDGITWTISVFASTPGTIIVSIPVGVIQSLTGTSNFASTSTINSVTFDNVTPTVTINQAVTQQDPTNSNPVFFTAIFSKPINPATFTASDVVVGGTALGAIAGTPSTLDNITWTIPVTGIISTGTVTASIAAARVKDLANNNNKASTSTDNTVNFLFGAPSLTINQAGGQPDPTGALPLKYSIVFSQPVDPLTFTLSDLTITGTAQGAATSNLTSSDNITWSVDIIGLTSSGTVVLSLDALKVKNLSAIDNVASTSTDNTVLYNFGSLSVAVEQDPSQSDPATAGPVFYNIIFNQAINPATFSAGDITLSGTATGATVGTPLSANNRIWTVPVTQMTGSGTLLLSIAPGLVQDFAGNANSSSSSIDNLVTYNDLVPPSITALSPVNGDLFFTPAQDIVLTFNKSTKSYDRKLTVYKFSDHTPIVLDLPAAHPSVSTSFTFPTVAGATSLLVPNEKYYVRIPKGNGAVGFASIIDIPFPGIPSTPIYFQTSTTAWIFQTADSQGPAVVNDLIDFTDIFLQGGNLRLQMNRVSTIYYLISNSGDPVPTQDQIINPTNVGNPYSATPVSSGNYLVQHAYQDIFIPIDAAFTNAQYSIYVTAKDAANNLMGYNGATAVAPTYLAKNFTAVNPPPGPFDPLIVSYPLAFKVCIGLFQSLTYPITIAERNPGDFGDGSFSIALPTGFEFNQSLINVAYVTGQGSPIQATILYKTSSILRVDVSNTRSNRLEKIIISGLQIIAHNTAISGPILRLGGRMLPTIGDFSSLGTLIRLDPPNVTYKALLAGVDNTLIADDVHSVLLLSDSTQSGQNIFTGTGVQEDIFNPFFAKIGSHPVSLTYTDVNGCVSQSNRTIRVYNHARAINGIDTLYCTNAVKVRISNIYFDGSSSLDTVMMQLITPNGLVSPITVASSLTYVGGSYYFDPGVMSAAGETAKLNNSLPAEGGTLAIIKFSALYRTTTGSIDVYDQVVTINVPPTVGISFSAANLINSSGAYFCEDVTTVDLDGAPRPVEGLSTATFKINQLKFTDVSGYVDRLNGTGKITPAQVDPNTQYAPQTITYSFKSLLTGCSNLIDSTLFLAPKPIADFSIGAVHCIGLPVSFNGQAIFNSGVPPTLTDNVTFVWGFDDPQGSSVDNTSSLQSPQHTYTSANNVIPALTVISKHGCYSDLVSKNFQIGAIPDMSYAFSGVSGVNSDFITFNNTSTLYSAPSSNSSIDYVKWDYGDNSTQTILTNFTAPVNHTFPVAGVYAVSLTVHTNFGCAGALSQKVVVLGNNPVADDNFEGLVNWVTYSATGNSSWVVGSNLSKSKIAIDPLINGQKVWVTSLSGSYLPNENSALYSPVFDLTQYSKPAVSFDNFTQIANSDGVVLQYSVDNKNVGDVTKVWTTLGKYDAISPAGIGWYNDLTLPSTPGGLEANPAAYAWTGTGTASWHQSKYSLDVIKAYNKVVFRFALGSVTTNPATDGFALDNFVIGQRRRIVLVENFTSTNVPKVTDALEVKKVADKLTTMIEGGASVIAINYHVDYSNIDPFNRDSPAEPSSRALFYSATKVPQTQVDGVTDPLKRPLDQWVDQSIALRQLDVPKVSVKLVNVHNTDRGSLMIDRIDVQAFGNFKNATLFVAVIENNIDANNPKLDKKYLLTGETKFNYVLKKFLPTAAGIKLGDLTPGGSLSFDNLIWVPNPNQVYQNNFMVVAFIQNFLTKEVYTLELSSPMAITNGQLVTGVEDLDTSLSVYPIPADREIHIVRKQTVGEDISLRLINQVGMVISKQTMKKEELNHVINSESLATGLYILETGEGAGVTRRKLIVVH